MPQSKVYSRINWVNEEEPALNETNLNKVDYALDVIDDRVVELDITKAKQSDLNESLKTLTFDQETGVFTFEYWNGSQLICDINVEKIPVSFSLSDEGILKMVTDDGTEWTCDISKLIKTYSFLNSDTINFEDTVDESGNHNVTAKVKIGSITDEHLQPNYLADITKQANLSKDSSENSKSSSLISEGFAKGTQNGEPVGEDSEYYNNNAEYFKNQAQSMSNIGNGLIKVKQGENELGSFTTNQSEDAIINIPESNNIEVDSELSSTSENPVQNKVVTQKLGTINEDLMSKVDLPKKEDGSVDFGEKGKVLSSNGDGTTEWINQSGEGSGVEETTNLVMCTMNSGTSGNVSYTKNSDCTYTFNGTSNTEMTFLLANIQLNNFVGKKLKLTCIPKSIGSDNVYAYIKVYTDANTDGEIIATDKGNGVTFTVPDGNLWNIYLYIANGVKLSNVILKPMITTNLNSTYDDFVSYTGSTGKLNSDVAELRSAICDDAWNTSKTYKVGTYVIYNNALWKCLIQNKGESPIDGSEYWKKCEIANELKVLNSNMDDVIVDTRQLHYNISKNVANDYSSKDKNPVLTFKIESWYEDAGYAVIEFTSACYLFAIDYKESGIQPQHMEEGIIYVGNYGGRIGRKSTSKLDIKYYRKTDKTRNVILIPLSYNCIWGTMTGIWLGGAKNMKENVKIYTTQTLPTDLSLQTLTENTMN